MLDRFNGTHSTRHPGAVAHYADALHAVLGHRPGAIGALDAALALDPDFVAAHALKGFALVLLARSELLVAARQAARQARRALAVAPVRVEAESVLVAALEDAVAGHFMRAADRLETGLWSDPRNVLLLKLSHALRFMVGDAAGMLQATSWAVRHGHPDDAGTGYVFGCHAFALEEHACFADADCWAEKALALAPDDAWALHAASHVDEMQGRTVRGIRRLEATRPLWSGCNNFQFHMAWHLALFHVDAGDHDQALDLYDTAIRHERTDDFRDVSNAASLLWRLRQRGVAVGSRWEEIADIARRRSRETTLAFASLHNLLALAAQGETEAIDGLLAAWRAKAATDRDDQARGARFVAVRLAEVLAGREGAGTDYADIAARLQVLGGSNAQRDVFLLTLAERARATGQESAERAIARIRVRQRQPAQAPSPPLLAVA